MIMIKEKERNLILQHVEERGLAGVVEAQKQNLGLLLPQAQRGKDAIEPVDQEHGFFSRTRSVVG